jgi:hypothetical protein
VTTTLAERLGLLVGAFNAHSLDVPDGLLDRGCVFRLNGVAYEDTMGRPVTDPIVRLIARGPAAYRFLAQALRYALPDATLRIDGVVPDDAQVPLVSTVATIEGTLRGTQGPFRAKVAVALVIGESRLVQEVAAMMPEDQVAAVRDARNR